MAGSNLALALRAVKIVENDSGTIPTFADLLNDAIMVDDMAAFKLYGWLLPESSCVTN